MRVLVGCERFGKTREAFRRRGHYAWSCDIHPDAQGSEFHLLGDVRDHLERAPDGEPWDLGIFHPDCTYLTKQAEWAMGDGPYHMRLKPETLVGAARRTARANAVAFVFELRDAPIKRIAIENPSGHLSTAWRKPDQAIHPHWFGEDASKMTCLWLKNLPPLSATQRIAPRIVNGLPRWGNQTDSGQNKLQPSAERAMLRAATYAGISEAFADQWGSLGPLTWSDDLFAQAAE